MQLLKTSFLDSAIFIVKKWWGIDDGEKVKFGGENVLIHSLLICPCDCK
jgi:hypothetical protein